MIQDSRLKLYAIDSMQTMDDTFAWLRTTALPTQMTKLARLHLRQLKNMKGSSD